MSQLDLNFAGYDQPNRHGVYDDCERLAMPRGKSKGKAEIRIAFTAAGFLFGESAEMEMEGFGGLPSNGSGHYRQAVTTRAEAIGKACDNIRRFAVKKKSKASTAILAWIDTFKEAA